MSAYPTLSHGQLCLKASAKRPALGQPDGPAIVLQHEESRYWAPSFQVVCGSAAKSASAKKISLPNMRSLSAEKMPTKVGDLVTLLWVLHSNGTTVSIPDFANNRETLAELV